VAQQIASELAVPVETIAQATTHNFEKLFLGLHA
jgi:Tat protein secretion system quality control protein TatD with DNase activity